MEKIKLRVCFEVFAAAAFAVTAVFASKFAFAAEHGEAHGQTHEVHWDTLLISPLIHFTIFVLILRYCYRKYAANLLKARSVQIRQQLEHAGATIAEAQAGLAAARDRLRSVEAEKATTLLQFETEGRRMTDAILENAKRTSERLQSDADRQIENEMTIAKKELRREVVSLASKSAREKLQRGVSPDVDRRLRRDALRMLTQ